MVTDTEAEMSETRNRFASDLAFPIAGAALLLGLFADALFNGAALGLNVPLWVGALVGAFVLAARLSRMPVGRVRAGLLAVALVLSMMIAWRSAAALQVVLLIASVGALLLAVATPIDARARRASITLLFGSLAVGLLTAVRGTYELVSAVPWGEWRGQGAHPHARAVGRATLIALPLLLGFGALFFAADAVFETWIRDALSFDLTSVRGHVGWMLGGASVAGGLLWSGLSTEEPVPSGPQLADERRLRAVETGVVLGSLAALFALFVGIQVQYLFGGQEHVQASTGLTYAEYARRGFFELVTVAVLLLPVLLAADWARARSGRSLATFRVLGGLLVLLLLVVMTSAFQRLRIYVDAYGLTALRLYAAALLAWLGAVSVWLSWSLLRERRDQFVIGAVTTALVALVALVAINPHGLIATTNLSRVEEEREFDTIHALRLSADATPTLVTGLDVLLPGDACQIARSMLERWGNSEDELRSWNWGRSAASESVESNRARLQSACQ